MTQVTLAFIQEVRPGHLVFKAENGKYKGHHIAFWRNSGQDRQASLDLFVAQNHGDVVIETSEAVLDRWQDNFLLAQKLGFK